MGFSERDMFKASQEAIDNDTDVRDIFNDEQ
jgi:hypothetical protein